MARRPSPCLFCGLTHTVTVGRCAGCGGPLAAPVGPDPGPPPAPAPRPIAAAWIRREVYQFPVVWGVAFGGGGGGLGCLVGVVLTAAFLGLGLLPVLPFVWLVCGALAGIFALVGGIVFAVGVREGRRRLALFRDGVAARAEVVRVTFAPKGPEGATWTVHYTFDRDGEPVGGSAAWSSPVAERFAAGDRLHVVYDPADPSRSVPWPPPA